MECGYQLGLFHDSLAVACLPCAGLINYLAVTSDACGVQSAFGGITATECRTCSRQLGCTRSVLAGK